MIVSAFVVRFCACCAFQAFVPAFVPAFASAVPFKLLCLLCLSSPPQTLQASEACHQKQQPKVPPSMSCIHHAIQCHCHSAEWESFAVEVGEKRVQESPWKCEQVYRF